MVFDLQWWEYLIVAAMIGFGVYPALYVARRIEKHFDWRLGGKSVDGGWELAQSTRKLQEQFDDLREDYDQREKEYKKEIGTLKSQISMLFERWQVTIEQLTVVEQENHKLQTQVATLQAVSPASPSALLVPLLLVCGDPEFCEVDADRLNQTGIYYRMLQNATKDAVKDELQYKRLDGNLYPWLHVSAHGSRAGIQLADGLADARFWNRTLEGVRVVFLASCDGPEVADLMIGVVERVIVFYGDIKSETAALFTLSFWRAKKRLLNADKAFELAVREVPEARPFVDLRRS